MISIIRDVPDSHLCPPSVTDRGLPLAGNPVPGCDERRRAASSGPHHSHRWPPCVAASGAASSPCWQRSSQWRFDPVNRASTGRFPSKFRREFEATRPFCSCRSDYAPIRASTGPGLIARRAQSCAPARHSTARAVRRLGGIQWSLGRRAPAQRLRP